MTTIALERAGVRYRVALGSWVPRLVGHDCVTIYRTIYCRHDWLTAETHAHEFAHVAQWRQKGAVWFALSYLWYQLTRGYERNRYELRAKLYARLNAATFRGLP